MQVKEAEVEVKVEQRSNFPLSALASALTFPKAGGLFQHPASREAHT